MTKEDFALLRESLEQAVALRQGRKSAASSVDESAEEDADDKQILVLKNGSIIKYMPNEVDANRGKEWFVQF